MPHLFLDIETIGTARQDVRDYIAAGIKPPGNISKAETIAKWEAESKPAAIADAIDKTSFDGAFGRVCCIGFAMDDGEPETVFSADDERLVLEGFAYILDCSFAGERFTTTVVGHNVSAFDLRFLHQRYIVHGIRPPIVIARAISARPWESEKVYDTMVQWAGVGNRVSLDKRCLALSIPSPKAMPAPCASASTPLPAPIAKPSTSRLQGTSDSCSRRLAPPSSTAEVAPASWARWPMARWTRAAMSSASFRAS